MRASARRRAAAMAAAGLLFCSMAGCGAPPAPAATPAPEPSAHLDLPAKAWWGGPAYYAQFRKAADSGWSSPSFFPLAVFAGKPDQARALKQIGITTYLGVEHDGSPISSVTSTGMTVLAQLAEWSPAEIGDDARVVGWNLSDECEMGYSGCGDDEQTQLATQRSYAAQARSREDGRLLQANFGNGVLGSYWSTTTMADHLSLVDLSSVDKYAYTSPHVGELIMDSPAWPAGKNPASSFAYGWVQRQMDGFSSVAGSKPNWVLVETGKPYLSEAGSSSISPQELRGAVWNAIISGASGIAYFQHSNDPSCGNYSLVDCAQTRDAVAQLNRQITDLAPVLNSPPVQWTVGEGLQATVRSQGGYVYVMAMTDGGTGQRTLSLPAGLRGNTVEVMGENRTLEVHDAHFSDSFDNEYSYHIYRIVI
ncbi:hypothetical protein SAMN05443377_1187 [Propionibacterium cyclohexanicum]|uniref:Glycosyl hydrolase catalytic core n=1 Tax=Propionibacterium cyclohexanicum TaxID=64702 RepID=A0A1H9T1Y7_9ACTN|nr:hypothetical protein [Propionibacterium cyclohexanicum]SER91282.1 hypothetical protein SAMN05443377_1187 [Propionibacterium cyclohexanicum]